MLPVRLRGVHWRFNAWGGLYRDFRCDQAVAQKVLELDRLRALLRAVDQ